MTTIRYHFWMLNMPRSEWFALVMKVATERHYSTMRGYWEAEVRK